MGEEYVPSIMSLKISKIRKRMMTKSGEKTYIQGVITLPKKYLEKLEKNGVDSVIAIADDFFIAVPPRVLKTKNKGELISEFSDLLDWLKEHVYAGDEG